MVAFMTSERTELLSAEPNRAARMLIDHDPSADWLDAFMNHVTTLRSASELTDVLTVWGLSQAEFAEAMGVSRQAVGKWLERLPADRLVTIANLAAATELLVHYVRRERIPAVVRRPAPALGNRSLLDLVTAGEHAAVLVATRHMFDPAGTTL